MIIEAAAWGFALGFALAFFAWRLTRSVSTAVRVARSESAGIAVFLHGAVRWPMTHRPVLFVTTLLLAALSLFILWGAARADFSLLPESAKSSLDRCYRRCEKNNPPIPSPDPTRSPAPPTRTMGKSCDYYVTTQRTITFPVQDEPTILCIDPPLAPVPTPFIEIGTVNGGNASCADFWMQGYSPTGAVSEPSYGAQPGVIMARVPGRYYAFVVLKQANNTACSTLTVHVR